MANLGRGGVGIDDGLRIIDDLEPQTPGAGRAKQTQSRARRAGARTHGAKQSQFGGVSHRWMAGTARPTRSRQERARQTKPILAEEASALMMD